MNSATPRHQTAAILIIGNEVLSGRTREANAWLAAQKLFEKGCKLREIAVVADRHEDIVSTLHRLRSRYDAVITSGGIGPTHDDITMDAVSDCFGVRLLEHEETMQKLHERYGDALNAGRRRMARLPEGAAPILCEASFMPGAHISNVYVLAGVPSIFASQLDSFLNDFGGLPFLRQELAVQLPESVFAQALTEIQAQFDDVEIGSYPTTCSQHPSGKICLSSQQPAQLNAAFVAVERMIQTLLENR